MKHIVTIEENHSGVTSDFTVEVAAGQSLVAAIVSAGLQPSYDYNILDVVVHAEDDPPIPPNPQFPDRPHTLDFARLSAAVIEIDQESDAGATPPEVIGVDGDSLLYAVSTRLAHADDALEFVALVTGRPVDQSIMRAAAWLDGFAAGQRFERRGGHRED